MPKVQCHECGRRYDFDQDDFCPRCGAFTRPVYAVKQTDSVSCPDSQRKRTEGKLFGRSRNLKETNPKQKRQQNPISEAGNALALEVLGEVLDLAFDLIDP